VMPVGERQALVSYMVGTAQFSAVSGCSACSDKLWFNFSFTLDFLGHSANRVCFMF
jgi:hypothetical protein